MQITFVAPSYQGPGALALGVGEGLELGKKAGAANEASGGALKQAIASAPRFKGKSGQVLEFLVPQGLKASRILIVGTGKAAKFDAPAAERAGAEAVGKLLTSGIAELVIAFDPPKDSKLDSARLAAHLAMGARLRSYAFTRYRTKDREEHEPTLTSVRIAAENQATANRYWQSLEAVAGGIELARDLVNEPPNVLSPAEFATRARALTKEGLKVEVLGEAEMHKLDMGALLGVGQGSERESQLVVVQWNGARDAKKAPIAFVGKGVCFDSGGLSLKSGQGMMGMKGDMGGAAAALGTMLALARRKAKVNAVGIMGLVENMPSGKAQRPDDVVKSMSGQTIEVLNTDAEGRLVLADALWYAQTRFKPKFVIDLATLTGAIMVALGHEHAGLFSNDDKLAERLMEAGREVGEPIWRLPLGDAYDKAIKSKIADMKNVGGPSAGSITAAQFLKRFIDKTPWAHLDIAGVAWQDGESKLLSPGWATGWGVRVLDRLVKDHYES